MRATVEWAPFSAALATLEAFARQAGKGAHLFELRTDKAAGALVLTSVQPKQALRMIIPATVLAPGWAAGIVHGVVRGLRPLRGELATLEASKGQLECRMGPYALTVDAITDQKQLDALNPQPWPKLEPVDGGTLTLDAAEVLRAKRAVGHSMLRNDVRPVLRQICIRQGLELTAQATDGHRLAKLSLHTAAPTLGAGMELGLHREWLGLLTRHLERAERITLTKATQSWERRVAKPNTGKPGGPPADLNDPDAWETVQETTPWLVHQVGPLELAVVEVSGKFPQTESVIPEPRDSMLVVNPRELMERAAVLRAVSVTGYVTPMALYPRKQGLTLATTPDVLDGPRLEVSMDCKSRGRPPQHYAVNALYLLDALRPVQDVQDVQLEISKHTSAMRVWAPTLPDYEAVVMPVRVDWNPPERS